MIQKFEEEKLKISQDIRQIFPTWNITELNCISKSLTYLEFQMNDRLIEHGAPQTLKR
jgi:hypothetical protein